MRRLAVAMAGLALVAAVPAPAAAAARSAAAPDALDTPAAAKPSPKKSSTPSPKPAHPAAPALPAAVPSEAVPTAQCPPPGQTVSAHPGVPWAQQALDFSSVWPLTEGQGVTVAVVGSGVDYTPQLAGRVSAIDLTGTGPADCVGHGTAIAAIIAASDQQAQGNPFEGVAPEARILSIKVQNADSGSDGLALAQGIRDAALLKAGVINVSITTRNNPGLASAVAFALRQGSVIVAAGGNDDQQAGVGPFCPASYPGVLSVGAVASDGSLAPFSDQRSHVAVTAPGVAVTSAYPGSGYQVGDLNGTSYATAFVSGVVALLRARYPHLTAAAVVRRIEQTANGDTGPGTGDSLVNPLQVITAIVPPGGTQSPPAARPQPVPVDRASPPDRAVIDTALGVTAGALGAAAVVALGAVLVGQGRRRRWRAGPAEVPANAEAPGRHW
jgi:membrane-anchored mycosin MYCP